MRRRRRSAESSYQRVLQVLDGGPAWHTARACSRSCISLAGDAVFVQEDGFTIEGVKPACCTRTSVSIAFCAERMR